VVKGLQIQAGITADGQRQEGRPGSCRGGDCPWCGWLTGLLAARARVRGQGPNTGGRGGAGHGRGLEEHPVLFLAAACCASARATSTWRSNADAAGELRGRKQH